MYLRIILFPGYLEILFELLQSYSSLHFSILIFVRVPMELVNYEAVLHVYIYTSILHNVHMGNDI